MHILIVADGRSPTTRHWIRMLQVSGYCISLVSTFPCEPHPGLKSFEVIPVAFSRMAAPAQPGRNSPEPSTDQPSLIRQMIGRFRPVLMTGRYYLGPLSVRASVGRFRSAVQAAQPDLIHALRIPFEGMLAAYAPSRIPMVVSSWGNDLTLHAQGSPWMSRSTRLCLQRAQGFIADTERDVRLARVWGLSPETPNLTVPGAGGIDLEKIRACNGDVQDLLGEGVTEETPLMINPRGIRSGSVRTQVFFQSIPLLLEKVPNAVVICPALAGEREAAEWLQIFRERGLDKQVRLLPTLPQTRLWDLFHRSQVLVSPSAHDGTPNSLLEGMACGCFPVAGDIESLREWITPGVNGLLFPPDDSQGLANALILALSDSGLRSRAAVINKEMIAQRADVHKVRVQVEEFYSSILDKTDMKRD